MSAKITYVNGTYLTTGAVNSYFGTTALTGHKHTQTSDNDSAPFVDLTAHVTGKLPFMNAVAPQGYISGLEMYFPGLPPRSPVVITDSVSFRAGSCTVQDVAGNMLVVNAPAGSKKMVQGWTAGTGGNGLPGALSLTNAWYFVYLIVMADGVTCDWGFDSVSPTNLLATSGAVYYRRIGSIWYQGNTDKLRQFRQAGNEFRYAVAPSTSVSVLTGGNMTLITLSGPPLNIVTQAILSIYASGPNNNVAPYGSTSGWLIGDWDENNMYMGNFSNHISFSGEPGPLIANIWASTTAQVQYATTYGSTTTPTIGINVKGYMDPRV